MICALVVTFVVFWHDCKGVPSLDPDLHDDLKTCALLFFYVYACVAFNVISLIRSFVLLTEVTTWWY